ncbi:hypothetical protein EV193_101797 [Herbihabitans rhizosphaerae]|uniref:PPE domain-containing protein n=1 Tax=Herbihabitans rhizosphaerae TaxID=1872711 RepID=A0A4Q7L6M6_9PSEU|nr:hypothetical protein [Herbihabitans rhizosphaerae]RZS44916.1 hypothetical protein EV193_101797 [Herbihabitans rhizosphaerae]
MAEDRHGSPPAQTSEQMRDDAARSAERDDVDGWFLIDLLNKVRNIGQREQMYDQALADQSRALADGQTLRDTPAVPKSVYLAVPHPELRNRIDGVSPEQIVGVGDDWIATGRAMRDFEADVGRAVTASRTSWRGTAGEAARDYLEAVGKWVGRAGDGAGLTGTQMNMQADAASTARATMPPPVPFDANAAAAEVRAEQHPMRIMTLHAQHLATHAASQVAHQEAARVMAQYDSSLAGTTMPAFAKPPTFGSKGGDRKELNDEWFGHDKPGADKVLVKPLDKTGEPATDSRAGDGDSDGKRIEKTPDVRDTDDSRSRDDRRLIDPYRPPIDDGRLTDPRGYQDRGTTDPSWTVTPDDQRQQRPTSYQLPQQHAQQAHTPPFGPPIGGPPSGYGQNGDHGRTGRGYGPTGSPAGQGANSGHNAGARGASGVGGEHGAAGRAGGGIAGGARGGHGGHPAGAPMGGRGQGEEDSEHQRPSYLVEADPHGVFGTDERTAPPVIGG